MTREPNYLVQLPNGTLYAYWHLDNLLCSIGEHANEPFRIFRRADAGVIVRYLPVSVEELRKGAA